MIPILYASNEAAFASNGLGRLRDCISCTVTEERNGVYECSFEYPVTGQNYDKIKLGRIIAVEHDDTSDMQPFDIVSCTRPINGVVTFRAVHISYRQRFLTVSGTGISSLADAFTVFGTAQPSNPFLYSTDKTSTGYVAAFDGTPRSVRSILGGVEGSILDAYGGEYEWNKWQVILHVSRGSARNLVIRYGVNMIDYTEDLDYSESYTSVIPYWVNSSDGTIVTGSMVSSGVSPYNGVEACVPMDLTDKFDAQPTTAQLEATAAAIMAQKQTYMPAQTVKVDFIRLQDSAEYENLAPLLNCRLCDTVKVVMPRYNMSGRMKIVKTVYNVLLERYDSMELGTLSTSLSEALGISNGLGGSSGSGGGGSAVPNILQATGSGTISLTAGTVTKVPLSVRNIDVGEGLDISDGGIQVTKTGLYRITASVYIVCTASVNGYAVFVRHGSAFGSGTIAIDGYQQKPTGLAFDNVVTRTRIVALTGGEIVYLAGRVSGSTGTLQAGATMTFLQIEQVA